MKNNRGTIAVDFDGVIHSYSQGWKDGSIYDSPISKSFESIRLLMDSGYSVFIFSTRSPHQIKSWIKAEVTDWECVAMDIPCECWKYGFSVEVIPFWKKFWNKQNVLGITKRKLPALVYIDDRAIRFQSWANVLREMNNRGYPTGLIE